MVQLKWFSERLPNMQLKSRISFARTKHLPTNSESQFATRRLRGLAGCSVAWGVL